MTLLASGQVCSVVFFPCPDHVELSTAVLRPKLSTSHQAIQAYGVFEQNHISMHMILFSDDDALTTMCRRRDGCEIPNKMDTSIEHTWDLTYFDQQNVGFSRNWDFIGISARKLEHNWMQAPKICGLLWLSPSKSSFKKLNEGNNQQNAWHRNPTEVPQSILPISNWCFH